MINKEEKDAIEIAKFLGWKVELLENAAKVIVPKYERTSRGFGIWGFGGLYWSHTLKFHRDWNWLMFVKEKINSLENRRFDIRISQGLCEIYDGKTEETVITITDEDAFITLYKAVIAFIEWYNVGKR